jgi:hypothetical protein
MLGLAYLSHLTTIEKRCIESAKIHTLLQYQVRCPQWWPFPEPGLVIHRWTWYPDRSAKDKPNYRQ